MEKYELLPRQLMHEGTSEAVDFFTPGYPDPEHILRAHNKDYYNRLTTLDLDAREVRRIGFPLSEALVQRELIIAQGTIMGCEMALHDGIAMNIAGGTHHAYSDKGEAFCMLNDQAIGAHYLLHSGMAGRILIVDLDVHQGNGTAEIFASNEKVFTFSMHGKNNYPFKKEVSDLDIALEDKTGDEQYLAILRKTLPKLIASHRPDFIFYLSGVDVIAGDKLGKLGLSMEGCRQRDAFVLETCHELEIPVQCSMGGGYSKDIRTIIEAHANTYRLAREIYF